MYNVVSDINRYKLFVPFCIDSKILSSNPTTAKLVVGFSGYTEDYISNVKLNYNHVQATSTNTKLFLQLENDWRFSPLLKPVPITHPFYIEYCKAKNVDEYPLSRIDFRVEFLFRNSMYQNASAFFIDGHARNMISAFEKRAFQLFGEPTQSSHKVM
jgi:coenzyme Q-binding protein COQ10